MFQYFIALFAALAIICEGKPGLIASPLIAAPYVAAQSSQVFARNYNGVYPALPAPARLLSPYTAQYAAAPLAGYPGALPYTSAFASPYVASPYSAAYAAPFAAPYTAPFASPYVASPYIRSPFY
ncbi:unnamed protein product [Diamesa hyperborea]